MIARCCRIRLTTLQVNWLHHLTSLKFYTQQQRLLSQPLTQYKDPHYKEGFVPLCNLRM